jgi:hypothetical protein
MGLCLHCGLCLLSLLPAGCGQMARDKFPGLFKHALLNGKREDLYERYIPRPTPTQEAVAAAATGAPPPTAIPAPLPPSGPAVVPPLPPGTAPAVPPLPPALARVPPLPPSPAARPPPIDALVPPLSEPGARPAPVRLGAWLRHGEAPEVRRRRVAEFAASLVGLRRVVVGGKRYPANCSDFVRAVYSIEGVDLYKWPGRPAGHWGVRSLYALAKASGGLHFLRSPEVGDLVFFHHTYDFNRNGRVDDFLSHVGIVERADRDGTIHYIDRSSGRIKRNRMNLRRPHLVRDPMTLKRLNSHVRGRRRGDPVGTRYLAGELFAGFGTLLR